MSISILNRGASGGLKPELTVTAPAGSTIDILENGILTDTYTLGASETEHIFTMDIGSYVVRCGYLEKEVKFDVVAQYVVDLRPYVTDGLILNLNGYLNTRNGHAESPSAWEDLSGNNWDASLVGSPTWIGNGLRFNGSSNYANLTNTGARTATVKTVEIFCKVNTWANRAETVLYRGSGVSAANNHIQYSARDSGTNYRYESFVIVGYNTGAIFRSYSHDTFVAHSVAFTMGNGFVGYHNGIQVDTDSGNNNVPATNSTEFFIGRGASGRYCSCDVYAVRLYNRKLTAEEIAHNYEVDQALLM